MKVLLGSQSYQSRSVGLTGQRLVNLYMEPSPEGSKYPFALYGTPGLKVWRDLKLNSGIDGVLVQRDNLFVVVDRAFYHITPLKIVTLIGRIDESTENVQLSANETQVVALLESGNAYVFTKDSLQKITSEGYRKSSSVTFLDGFHIFSEKDSSKFFISSLFNALEYNPLDFASAVEKPDDIVALVAFNSAVWIFGTTSTEIYYNSGNADFPLEQIGGAVNTTRGCGARDSIAQEDNGLFWLGDDGVVYRANDYSPQRISTFPIEGAIQSYSRIDNAIATTYTQEGHKFYCLTFPSDDKTWVFDIATGLWHERESSGGRWCVNSVVAFDNKVLASDCSKGIIYELDLDVATENGDFIKREAVAPPSWFDGSDMFHDAIRLDMDTGVGLTSGQGSDPLVVLQYSNDGGNTWGNERVASIGKRGDYKRRIIWRRLGRANERLYRVTITDPVPVRIIGAYLEARQSTQGIK